MFIHEQSLIEIHANLDESVSHGTLRTCDLVPVFMDVIKDTPEYVQLMQSNNYGLSVISDPCADDEDERWDSEAMSYFLNENLFDTLNDYAPEGYYFSSHPGDGSDFGYWKIEENESN